VNRTTPRLSELLSKPPTCGAYDITVYLPTSNGSLRVTLFGEAGEPTRNLARLAATAMRALAVSIEEIGGQDAPIRLMLDFTPCDAAEGGDQ
jgi:hypothetical protein